MCGRFVSASSPDELAQYFGAEPPDSILEPSYNVAPTADVYALVESEGHRKIDVMRWGLIPFWAKDMKIGSKMTNARSETLFEKPAFRSAVKRRRCLIPVDGFYEWAVIPNQKRKQPYYVHRGDGDRLVLAGLWEAWSIPNTSDKAEIGAEVITSCTIITCEPNDVMSRIHSRMPVVVAPQDWDRWIRPTGNPTALGELLKPAPNELLALHPVSTAVNTVRNNSKALIEPDTEQPSTSPQQIGLFGTGEGVS